MNTLRRWPLAVSSFSLLDRIRVGAWLVRSQQWTAGDEIVAYERRWQHYTGSAHAIMVSSGSAANELIALRRKYELQHSGQWPHRNKVVFPACTWGSSVTPWINAGFDPVFCDIGGQLQMSPQGLDAILAGPTGLYTAAVFHTTLLGRCTGLEKIEEVCRKYDLPLLLDNCESSFTRTRDGTHVCAFATSSTSLYFAHHTTTGTEGGMIFTASRDEAEWFRMMRNHGLTRGMPIKYHNPDVHPAFDFHLLGSNYRSSNLAAYMAGLDFDRALAFGDRRRELAWAFYGALDIEKFRFRPWSAHTGESPFCLVIEVWEADDLDHVKAVLESRGIEYRPVVAGNLLRHTAFRSFANPLDFPRANELHDHGVYIGLHPRLGPRQVVGLARALSK